MALKPLELNTETLNILSMKPYLTANEASLYFNIGIGVIYRILRDNEDAPFCLHVGKRRLVDRELFQEYLRETKQLPSRGY